MLVKQNVLNKIKIKNKNPDSSTHFFLACCSKQKKKKKQKKTKKRIQQN